MVTEIWPNPDIGRWLGLRSSLANLANLLSGGSSVSKNKLPQLILQYIYILKYLQSNFIDFILLKFITYDIVIKLF